ncbi:MAG: hypothetical protein ACOX69_10565 [Coriobacteriales bacterium]|jgi:hypothetical protein
MTKLILHIGTHKTGTTALQSTFAHNAKTLAAHGIGYPIAKVSYPKIPRKRNAYYLGRGAKAILSPASKEDFDDSYYKSCQKSVLAACNARETILLSDERLWFEGAIRENFWKTVKELLEPYGFSSIRIVLYLRRQDQFATSLWKQFVKGTLRESRPLEQYTKGKRTSSVLNYELGITRLEKAFGAENITIRIFDRAQFPGGDIVHDFCDCVGFDFFEELERVNIQENPSLTNRVAYLKNLVNRGTYVQEADNIFHRPSLVASALEEERDERPYLSYEQATSLLERYEEGNARIARDYFGREDGKLFSDPSPDKGHFEGDLSQTEIDALMMLSEGLCLERMQRLELQARVNDLEHELSAANSRGLSGYITHVKRGIKRRVKNVLKSRD